LTQNLSLELRITHTNIPKRATFWNLAIQIPMMAIIRLKVPTFIGNGKSNKLSPSRSLIDNRHVIEKKWQFP